SAQAPLRGGGPDPHVVAFDAEFRGKRSSRDIGPVLDALVPVIGEREHERPFLPLQPFSGGDERDDLDTQGERADAGILFPTILWAGWPVMHQKPRRTRNHRADAAQAAQLIFLHQLGGEDNGKRHLVELDPTPEWAPIRERVLAPASVSVWGGEEVAQHGARTLDRADGQGGEPRLDTIAGPDQMITARGVVGVSPRHAQAGDD